MSAQTTRTQSAAEGAAAGPSLCVAPSPGWTRAMPPGPDARVKFTEEYAKLVARDAYLWAWPLVNMYNRRLFFGSVKEMLYAGVLPQAPLNTFAMLTDYIAPEQRHVACPNQDVVYGAGFCGLDISPVVVQVPDFGERFWVYQILDLRTDAFAQLGKMYGTTPGFYMLAGPSWHGEEPKGISKVFRCPTNTAFVGPRIFQDDTPEDKQAIQGVLQQVVMYPLAEYDGTQKSIDWHKLRRVEADVGGPRETQWVFPEKFFSELPAVLADAPPLPGEEARYAQVLAVLKAAANNPALQQTMTAVAADAQINLIEPLFEFRNFGIQLPFNWTTTDNGAAFGTDYLTRTAVATSNIMVNAPVQAKYFYQDLDKDAGRLNGANRYTVTFAKEQTPPVHGFWSLTLYSQYHFFVPNQINRYSVGTKNKDLKLNSDGSLTFYVQADPPEGDQRKNWLPAPKDEDFSLFMRAYWPKIAALDGTWTPPAVEKRNRSVD